MHAFEQRQTIDLLRSNPVLIREQPIEKGDRTSLIWAVTVEEGGKPADLTGLTASLYCARSGDALSGSQSYGTTWSGASIDGNVIRAALPADAANVPGNVGCVLRVTEIGGAVVAMARMAVRAVDTIGTDIIDEGKRIPNIDELLATVELCERATDEATSAAGAATMGEYQRVEAEKKRVTAESARVESEKVRVTAETARVDAEQQRAAQESSRVAEEKKRVAAETSRTEAETKRGNAESVRENVERQRIAAESARVQAESWRVTAESARVESEKVRVTAETARVDAEQQRTTQESARVEEEKKRVEAEKKRVSAETGRANAETSRVEAEAQRVLEHDAQMREGEEKIDRAEAAANMLSNFDVDVKSLPPSSEPTSRVEQDDHGTMVYLGIPTSNFAYATFYINPDTRQLVMRAPIGFNAVQFMIQNRKLVVRING